MLLVQQIFFLSSNWNYHRNCSLQTPNHKIYSQSKSNILMSYLSFEGFETDQILSSCSPSKFKCWQELLNNSCIHFKWKLSSNVCPVNALPYHLSCQTAWVAAFSSFHSEQEILQYTMIIHWILGCRTIAWNSPLKDFEILCILQLHS